MTAGPVTVGEQVVDAYGRYVNAGQARLAKLLGLPVETRAEGCHVYDQHGVRYLDCGGYGVFMLGHRHPAVVAVVRDQLDAQPLSTRLFLSPRLAEAAAALAAITPAPLERVTFTCSGAESVEFALKLARLGGRQRVIAMENGFHGKTVGALSATGRDRYRAPFQPLLAGVEHVPFGEAEALEAALRAGPESLVLVEPVQAEGGVRIPPDGYLADVRRLCDEHGAMLAVDEIQTGLGRLGEWWGCDREGVVPDLLLTGKALGGGVIPVSAVVSTRSAYARIDAEPLLHSSTFAGNPLAAAAAAATLRVMREEGVPARAAALGRSLLAGLSDALAPAAHLVASVRGRGLMIGIEFRSEHHGARFLECMLDERVVVCYSLNADRVVRLTPSYLLSQGDRDWLLAGVSASARRLAG